MTENDQKGDKGEVRVNKPKKPPEYRRFEKLLKRAVNAPPMKKHKPKIVGG